jgi:hypothetical protein
MRFSFALSFGPTLAAGAALLLLTSLSGPAKAQETLSAPRAGDPVVVYVHKFKPANFEEGKKLVIEGFGEAMTTHGGDRLTFFLTDDDASEVITVSIFTNGSSVEKWHDAMSRHEVLEKLAPLRRQPLILQELRLDNVHVVE